MKDFIKQFFDIKFWKFIMVGILNTIVGMGLQFLFFNLCGWDEWVSSIVGYILGSILSYFLNKYFMTPFVFSTTCSTSPPERRCLP